MRYSILHNIIKTSGFLPLPWAAPSIIPGKSKSWMLAPSYSITPGIQVNVVNSYAAVSLCVFVNVDKSVDFPTDGKPT